MLSIYTLYIQKVILNDVIRLIYKTSKGVTEKEPNLMDVTLITNNGGSVRTETLYLELFLIEEFYMRWMNFGVPTPGTMYDVNVV